MLPVFGKGDTLFQPVYVGDVGRIVEILTRKNAVNDADGKIIEAGGPDGKFSHLKCDCDSRFISLDVPPDNEPSGGSHRSFSADHLCAMETRRASRGNHAAPSSQCFYHYA